MKTNTHPAIILGLSKKCSGRGTSHRMRGTGAIAHVRDNVDEFRRKLGTHNQRRIIRPA